MKKTVSLFLGVLMLFCVFTGCAQKMETVEWETAVDERVVDSMGKPRDEVMELFGLSEEEKSEDWPSLYVSELVWCGLPMNTEFGFTEKLCNTVIAKATLEDAEETEVLLRKCLELLEAQFNAPYRYTDYDFTEGGSLSIYEVPEPDAAFETFRGKDNGAICFRYSLTGENGGTGTDGSWLDIYFEKFENDPENVTVMINLQYYEP